MNRPTFNLSSEIPLTFSLHPFPATVVLGAVVLVVVKGQRLGFSMKHFSYRITLSIC
ncbi:hypothetical protein Hanom_Chr04g00319631 [Helianthus anomalus]